MSIQRFGVLGVVLTILIAVAACGGATSGTPQPGGGAAATPEGEPTDEAPDGGGGAVSIPPIPGSTYTRGTFHAEISGDATGTADLQFRDGTTLEGSTFINYGPLGDGDDAQILITPDLFGVGLSFGTLAIAGSTADQNRCNATFDQADAARVAATFECPDLTTFDSANNTTIKVDMRGNFEAVR